MATIFCFSATGNSLYAAKTLARKIEAQVCSMNEQAGECLDDVIGFVFPVYFWGLPRLAEKFISEIKITNKTAYIFAVATSGGAVFGALGRVKELLRSQGLELSYGERLIILSNYIPKYTIRDSEALRLKTSEKLSKIAAELIKRKTRKVSAFTWWNKTAYNAYPTRECDSDFSVSAACTGCGTCKKVCPAHNIAMQENKPQFRHNCEHCLSCLHNCPANAIDWQRKTQGKERYRHSEISINELIELSAGN